MRKVLLFLSSIILLLSSCESEKKDMFTITGTVAGEKNEGKAVFLQVLDSTWENRVNIDTAYVTDGKFEFSNEVKEPSICFIVLDNEYLHKAIPIPSVMETGKLRIKMDEDGSKRDIWGTPMNNASYKLFSDMGKDDRDDHIIVYNFAKENNQNVLGAYLFTWSMNRLPGDTVKDFLAMMNPELRKIKIFQNIESRIQERESDEHDETTAD